MYGLILFLMTNLLAETAPMKESNSDLRESKIMFSCVIKKQKRILMFSGSEYKWQIDNEERKIDHDKAQGLDKEFTSLFLRLQYEVDSPLNICDLNYELTLRNEIFKFCEKDDKRGRLIADFLNKTNSF